MKDDKTHGNTSDPEPRFAAGSNNCVFNQISIEDAKNKIDFFKGYYKLQCIVEVINSELTLKKPR
ncbi:MAG: hypothetical protein ACI9WT_001004 [Flavobacterium sp.]|jgi:hypothetical protein